jgi:hypothetical protein
METKKAMSVQQPEALAELAKTSREKVPGDGPRDLNADDETQPIPTDSQTQHEVAEEILAAGAKGETVDAKDVGANQLPDRTRSKI